MYKFRLVVFTKTKTKTKMISKIVATLETRLFDLIEMMAGGLLMVTHNSAGAKFDII